MTTRASSARRSSGKAKRGSAAAPPRDPNRLTPAEVVKHPYWGPLLRTHIPGYDPCAQAEGCYFDTAIALRKMEFPPRFCRHVKGPLHGKPFELMEWQKSVVANAQGWRKADGTRRYKVVFIYVGKKNGKTAWLGSWVAGELAEAPPGSELYGAAAAQKQAAYVFEHLAGMVKLHPIFVQNGFEAYGDKGGSVQKSVTILRRLVSYKCVAADADTVDGANPYLSVIDELHRHKKPEMAEVLETSSVQPNAQVIYITTADYDRPSLCNTKLHYARTVRANKGDRSAPGFDPEFLPCVWEADAKDDWSKESTWRKANPGLGVTKSVEFMREQARLAKEIPSKLNSFLRLHLNIVTSQVETWLPMDPWARRCVGSHTIVAGHVEDFIREHRLEGRPCYAGLDLAKNHDLTALVKLFPPEDPEDPEGKFIVVPRFWKPMESLRATGEIDHAPYEQWHHEGFLEATPGDVTDYNVIEAAIVEDNKRFPFAAEMAIDTWNATQIAQRLKDVFGVPSIEFIQGVKSYHPPLSELERLVRSGRLVHGAHPLLHWCASNLKVIRDDRGNVKPTKKRSSGRIDGITALCMALGVFMISPQRPQSAEQALLEEPLYE